MSLHNNLTRCLVIFCLILNLTQANFLLAFEGSVGTGTCGFKDGVPKDQALIGKATSLFESLVGDLYFYDTSNFRIMKVSQQDNLVSSIIGNGKLGYTEDHCQADKCGLTFVDGISLVSDKIFYFDRIITPTSSTRILRVVGSSGVVNTIWQVDYWFPTMNDNEKRTFVVSDDGKYLFFNHDKFIWKINLASMKMELFYTEPLSNKITTFTISSSGLIYSTFKNQFSFLYRSFNMDPSSAILLTSTSNNNDAYQINKDLGFVSLPKSIYCSNCIFSSIQTYGNTFNFTFSLNFQAVYAGIADQYLVLLRNKYSNNRIEFSNLDNGFFFIIDDCKITKSDYTSLNQGCTASCSNQGTCVGQICSCNDGWLGDSICSKFTCEKVDGCGLNGHCIGPNQCECKKGWSGPSCNDFDCSMAKNCSGHGKCIGSNYCECQSGWQGSDDCSQFSCEKITCQNNGQCNGPNQCECPSGYKGSPDCSTVSCELVGNCNSHGSCVAPNTCKCKEGWSGNDCSQFTCSPSCQNGGVCTAPNQCNCPSGYRGSLDCSKPSCEDQGNCYLNGECVGPNTCKCNVGWLGSNCKDPDCQLSCNNRGKCSKPYECECEDGWKGINLLITMAHVLVQIFVNVTKDGKDFNVIFQLVNWLEIVRMLAVVYLPIRAPVLQKSMDLAVNSISIVLVWHLTIQVFVKVEEHV
ncbi:predicted protein [Naegleria gruberi]|uniref:Predicted protein n=1 Tax=Naegleria gruberi TaxID=5762 RepID=D2W0J2_NAEGR|nr:uncharacterized protein NAEGRDRAFT_74878 [Naegleria gruberi]EFC37439.1 predicted protein [Naegleria gruberi]|eukprot:XP_002670183.1 predicted protein [Naegleria gruberi strain NEG-M]